MATKPRHLKTATQLWVYDNAKRLGLDENDLARATDVRPGTARSWFSRGKPNADAIPALERLFGRPAPHDDNGAAASDGAAYQLIADAIDRQTAMLERVLNELRPRPLVDEAWEAIRELAEERGIQLPVDLGPSESDTGSSSRTAVPTGSARHP